MTDKKPEINRGKKPSVGKAGTHGCFVVEVTHAGKRSLARRFHTREEADDYHARSVAAHQSMADRERTSYVISMYETATPKSAAVLKEHKSIQVVPL